MCVLIFCIIMTDGNGFVIVRDCKNVNMNQKSLRIVLVSVVFVPSSWVYFPSNGFDINCL